LRVFTTPGFLAFPLFFYLFGLSPFAAFAPLACFFPSSGITKSPSESNPPFPKLADSLLHKSLLAELLSSENFLTTFGYSLGMGDLSELTSLSFLSFFFL